MDVDGFIARSGAGESTLKCYGFQLRQCEKWMGRPLGDATEADLGRLKTKLRGMKSGSQYAHLLKMFYKAAKRDDLREMCVVKSKAKRLRPEDILTLPEVQALIDAAPNDRDRAFLVVLWETGVRIHEVCALHISDVREKANPDGTGTMYVIWFGKTKVVGEEHSGFILEGAPLLKKWLRQHPDLKADAPLFASWYGNPFAPDSARKMLYRAAKRAKVDKRVYPHLFRHSRATHLLRIGVPEMQVKKLLGWKANSTMLARYSHLIDADAYAALLKAQGYAVPKVELGRLSFEDTDLKPIVPVAAPPGQAPPRISTKEMSELLLDPKVARFLELVRTATK